VTAAAERQAELTSVPDMWARTSASAVRVDATMATL